MPSRLGRWSGCAAKLWPTCWTRSTGPTPPWRSVLSPPTYQKVKGAANGVAAKCPGGACCGACTWPHAASCVHDAPPHALPAGGQMFAIDRTACKYFRKDAHKYEKRGRGGLKECHEELSGEASCLPRACASFNHNLLHCCADQRWLSAAGQFRTCATCGGLSVFTCIGLQSLVARSTGGLLGVGPHFHSSTAPPTPALPCPGTSNPTPHIPHALLCCSERHEEAELLLLLLPAGGYTYPGENAELGSSTRSMSSPHPSPPYRVGCTTWGARALASIPP